MHLFQFPSTEITLPFLLKYNVDPYKLCYHIDKTIYSFLKETKQVLECYYGSFISGESLDSEEP
jgi:hypothetical protein